MPSRNEHKGLFLALATYTLICNMARTRRNSHLYFVFVVIVVAGLSLYNLYLIVQELFEKKQSQGQKSNLQLITAYSNTDNEVAVLPRPDVCPGTLALSPLLTSENLTLGDKMFMYASSYGISRKKQLSLIFPDENTESADVSRIFSFLSVGPADSLPQTSNRRTVWQADNYNDTWLYRIPWCDATVQLDGRLKSWKYFHEYRTELIQQEFTFSHEIIEQADFLLYDSLEEAVQTTELDFSNGDITKIVGIQLPDRHNKNWKLQEKIGGTADYLRGASNNSHLVFLGFCSSYCDEEEMNNLTPRITIVDESDDAVRMLALSRCHVVILLEPFSSIGWWAAYMSDGQVFVYHGGNRESETENYLLPEWIRLPAGIPHLFST